MNVLISSEKSCCSILSNCFNTNILWNRDWYFSFLFDVRQHSLGRKGKWNNGIEEISNWFIRSKWLLHIWYWILKIRTNLWIEYLKRRKHRKIIIHFYFVTDEKIQFANIFYRKERTKFRIFVYDDGTIEI